MSNSKTTTSSGGIGFADALTILFVGLKLANYIDWSWWWVLSPIWIPAAFVISPLLIVLLVSVIAGSRR